MAQDPYQSSTPTLLHRESTLTFRVRSRDRTDYGRDFDTLEEAATFARKEMESNPCRYWVDLHLSYVGVPATRGAEPVAGPKSVRVMTFEISKTDSIRCPGTTRALSRLAYEAAGGTKTDGD